MIFSLQAAPNEKLTLAHDGVTEYSICVAAEAIPAERTAAEQLQKYLAEATGAQFLLVTEAEAKGEALIFVGAGSRVKKLLPEENWEALGQDGIVIKTMGSSLVLAGGTPRGTLYSVFQFLEDNVGCRWWTPKEQTIPETKNLSIPPLDVRYVPVFSYREHFTTSVRYNPQFATILRENGRHESQDAVWGGITTSWASFTPSANCFLRRNILQTILNGTRMEPMAGCPAQKLPNAPSPSTPSSASAIQRCEKR